MSRVFYPIGFPFTFPSSSTLVGSQSSIEEASLGVVDARDAWQRLAALEGPRGVAIIPILDPSPSLYVMTVDSDGTVVGGPPRHQGGPVMLCAAASSKGGGSALIRAPVRSLADTPAINQSLLPQTRLLIESSPGLPEVLSQYGEALRHLDRAIGDQALPGRAGLIASEIGESLCAGGDVDLLSSHPVAQMVAASMVAHFREIGDLVGRNVYRDLATIFRCLQIGDDVHLQMAETMILQNLQINPFQIWMIAAGRVVAARIEGLKNPNLVPGKTAKDFDKLLQERQELARWDLSKQSRLIRIFHKKMSEGWVETAWSAWSVFETVSAIAHPVVAFLGGIGPSAGSVRKWLHYLVKSSREAKNVSEHLSREQRQDLLEISLYHEDYRGAVFLVEEGGRLRTEWEILVRREWGSRWEEEVTLQSIPFLGGHVVERSAAAAEIIGQITGGSIVGLLGKAGTGKTTLAAQVARYSTRRVFWYGFRGPRPNVSLALDQLAHFIENLNPAAEAGLLATVQGRKLADKLPIVAAALQRSSALIIFDNFQLVLESPEDRGVLSELVQKGISGRGQVDVVLIAREDHPLFETMGARIWRNQGLVLDEAKQLLKKMGVPVERLVESEFHKAYERVGGVPQALMLYGEMLLREERERVGFLTKPGPLQGLPLALGETRRSELDPHAAALRQLFRALYLKLKPGERALLSSLSVFRGPVPREAIEFVLLPKIKKLQKLLQTLRDMSILDERYPGSFDLHESLKALAYESIASSARQLHRRAAIYYRRNARKPGDFLESAHHSFMAGDYDRSISVLAGQTEDLFQWGYQARLEELLDRFGPETPLRPENRAMVESEKGTLAFFEGHTEEAFGAFRNALSIFEDLQQGGFTGASGSHRSKRGIASIIHRMGRLFLSRGDSDTALKLYRLSYDNYRDVADERGMASVLRSFGDFHERQGDWEEATLAYEASLAHYDKLGDDRGQGNLLKNLGDVFFIQGRWDQSIGLYRESLKVFEDIGDRYGMAACWLSIALIESQRGQGPKAIAAAQTAVALYRELDIPQELGRAEAILQKLENPS